MATTALITAGLNALPSFLNWASGSSRRGGGAPLSKDIASHMKQQLDRVPDLNSATPSLDKTVPVDVTTQIVPIINMQPHIVKNTAYRNAELTESHVKVVSDVPYKENTTLKFRVQAENGIHIILNTMEMVIEGQVLMAPLWGTGGTPTLGTLTHQSEVGYFGQATQSPEYTAPYAATSTPLVIAGRNNLFTDLFISIRLTMDNTVISDVKSTDFEHYIRYQDWLCPTENMRTKAQTRRRIYEGFNTFNWCCTDGMQSDWWGDAISPIGTASGYTWSQNSAVSTGQKVAWRFRLPHHLFKQRQLLLPGHVLTIEFLTSPQATHRFYGYSSSLVAKPSEGTAGANSASAFLPVTPWNAFILQPSEITVYGDKLQQSTMVAASVDYPVQTNKDIHEMLVQEIKQAVQSFSAGSWYVDGDQTVGGHCSLSPPSGLQNLTMRYRLQTSGTTPKYYMAYTSFLPTKAAWTTTGQLSASAEGEIWPVNSGHGVRWINLPCFYIPRQYVRMVQYEEDKELTTVTDNYLDWNGRNSVSGATQDKKGMYHAELATSTGFPDSETRMMEFMHMMSMIQQPRFFGGDTGLAVPTPMRTALNTKFFISNIAAAAGGVASTSALTNIHCKALYQEKLDRSARLCLRKQFEDYPVIVYLTHQRTIREDFQTREGQVDIEVKYLPFSLSCGIPGCFYDRGSAGTAATGGVVVGDMTIHFVPISEISVGYNNKTAHVNNLTDLTYPEDGLNRI